MAVASIAAGHWQRPPKVAAAVASTAVDWSRYPSMTKRVESPEVAALRQQIAAVIVAVGKAPDLAEHTRLIAERNRLGRLLANLTKPEQMC